MTSTPNPRDDTALGSTWTSTSNSKSRELAMERWEDDGGSIVVSVVISTARIEEQASRSTKDKRAVVAA